MGTKRRRRDPHAVGSPQEHHQHQPMRDGAHVLTQPPGVKRQVRLVDHQRARCLRAARDATPTDRTVCSATCSRSRGGPTARRVVVAPRTRRALDRWRRDGVPHSRLRSGCTLTPAIASAGAGDQTWTWRPVAASAVAITRVKSATPPTCGGLSGLTKCQDAIVPGPAHSGHAPACATRTDVSLSRHHARTQSATMRSQSGPARRSVCVRANSPICRSRASRVGRRRQRLGQVL